MKLTTAITAALLAAMTPPGSAYDYSAEYNRISGTLYNVIPIDDYLAANPKFSGINFSNHNGQRIIGFAESQLRTGWLTSKISFVCWRKDCNPVGKETKTVSSRKFKYTIEASSLDEWEYMVHVLNSSSEIRLASPVIIDEEISE
ncbi:MAG: hypothetical protein IJ523_11810 [Succinivibrionaceae bacterium]|nr:hypothetical protein [Succinivibrionaceae bacterium]